MMLARPMRADDAAAVQTLQQRGGLAIPGVALRDGHDDIVWLVEDRPDGRLLASARLVAAAGLDEPLASYHVGCVVHAARELQLFHRLRTLYLSHDHTGASALTDVAVAPEADATAVLPLLARAVLLWIAEHRERYAPRLIAPLPGVSDATGTSPFWRGLGQHFLAADPAQALATHGRGWKAHASALMPRHPLYASFLPAAAQAAIGQAHPVAASLFQVLRDEGLRYENHIDFVDGGPILEAELDQLTAVAGSRRARLALVDTLPPDAARHDVLALGDSPRLRRLDGIWIDGRFLALREQAQESNWHEGLPVHVALA